MKINRKMTDGLRSIVLHGLLTVGLLGAFLTPGSNPPTLPTVTITSASDPTAAEVGPDTGTFTVSRTGGTTVQLVVLLQTPTGSAQNVTDYQLLDGNNQPLGNYVTIPVGASSAEVRVMPVLDLDSTEGNEFVVLTLAENPNYYWINPLYASATVTIADVPQDSDTDDLSDAWEWWHFGGLGHGANEDYDGDGDSNSVELANGTDPNTIVFDVQFENLRVNGNTANGIFTPLKGEPAQKAVLVDSTDFTAATWLPYTPSLSVNLGSTDGLRHVWIGLKGRAHNSEATWGEWPLTRDTVAPVIVITNPVSTTVSRPMIQLQGYTVKPLSSVRYDVANAAGTLANEQGYVTKAWFDTNLWKMTTNWFECLDIELTTGANTITLRATDLAGNVATSAYTYVLDYSGDSSPPVLTMLWPEEGDHLSGSSFTFRGKLDDPTASVTAQIVSADGAAHVQSGLVERDGLLWVEDLPLADGTSTLTLTLTDAANNSSVTTLHVVKSDLILTMNPVTDDLWQRKVNVSGTVSDPSYAVWVNGIQADVNPSTGAWTASGVPVNEGGTASFDVTAYAPGEQQPQQP